jgi:hypothetical protein
MRFLAPERMIMTDMADFDTEAELIARLRASGPDSAEVART